MKTFFAPGCALKAYKPQLIQKISVFLTEAGLIDGEYATCCKASKGINEDALIINCCPGCGHMFGTLYPNITSVSLWEILLDTNFAFPDYHGEKMTIHDACHARHRNSSRTQAAARALCQKMNIALIEPAHTRDETRCCGGSAKDIETRKRMALRRAKDFPEENVVVYCTGCVRSLSLTNIRPRHLLDLLFKEPTEGLKPKA